MNKPKVVTLCGSSRFVDVMAVCAWMIEREEKAITMGLHLLPGWYSEERIHHHLAEHEGVADEMDTLHFRKIDISHELFIVNYGYYIGDSTTKEFRYGKKNNKKIRWYTHDPIGRMVDEIMARERSSSD